MIWTPVLNGAKREYAMQIVGSIAAVLRQRFEDSASVTGADAWSLATGRSGVALFFAYYGSALGADDAHAFAARLVAESLDAAAGEAVVDYLFEGFTGVAWTLAHVDNWVLDVSEGDPNDAVDDALLGLVTTVPWSGEYDLLAGLVGIGVYALERIPRPRGQRLLAAVVNRLSEVAARDPRHPFWWTAEDRLPANLPVRISGTGAWNYRGRPRCTGRDRAAGEGLRGRGGQRAPHSSIGPWNGCWHSDSPPKLAPRFRHSSARTGFPDARPWRGATAILARLGSCSRRLSTPLSPGVGSASGRDRGSRRNAAGVGQRRRRPVDLPWRGRAGAHLQPATAGRPGPGVLRAAAEGWLGQIVDSWQPGVLWDGCQTKDRTSAGGQAEPGFLTGAAGIGLVLLAAATRIEPRWDRVCLLS